MIQANFTVTPSAGDVLATNFTVTNFTSGADIQQYTWDFGTGENIYNVKNPSYVYKYPGAYTISLTAIDTLGNKSTYTRMVTADLAYRDYISFSSIPAIYANPGKQTPTPFEISVVSSNPESPIIVDLFAANSKSTPYQFIPTKWNNITPTWKFTDLNSNFITSLSVTPVPVYKNNVVVAVSGTAKFYYIDSMSTGNPVESAPLVITATLQTSGFSNPQDSNIYNYPSYANSKNVKVGLVWQVNDLFPTQLKVTSNYIDPIYPEQWTDIKIPVLVTAHSSRSEILPGSSGDESEPIFSYPGSNTIGKYHPVLLSLSGFNANQFRVDEAPLYFQTTDKEGYRTGGYVFTTITALTTSARTTVIARSSATTNQVFVKGEFPYPYGYVPNPWVWVSNPENSVLNRITLNPYPENNTTINYFKDNKILIDGYINQISVPSLTTSDTFNYTMSGFSGIYGIAIDPRNYEIVACDAELDRIYRISNTGEILKTLELSSIKDYDPQKKMFDFWTWKTAAKALSSSQYTVYNSTWLSPNPGNYIVTVGGAIQPTKVAQKTDERSFRLNAPPLPGGVFNRDSYPAENVNLNVIQVFNPLLSADYISSISYWLSSCDRPTNIFPIKNSNAPLSNDTNRYLVSVEGLLQLPTAYTIDVSNQNIVFSENIQPDYSVNVHYIPYTSTPANWIRTYTNTTRSIYFSLTGNNNYVEDERSGFLVNIGGILQTPSSYKLDIINKRLIFDFTLPAGLPISVTQLTVPDKLNIPAAYTPAGISLDKNYNIWVTLFNSISVLKFDSNLNLLANAAPSGVTWEKRAWTTSPPVLDYQSSLHGISTRYDDPNGPEPDNFTDEFFLKPPTVETDKTGNCWVTYANPLCSMLVKYSSTGNLLVQVPLERYSTPIDIAINNDNNVWVANSYGSTYTYAPLSGNLQLYSSTGRLLSTVRGITRPYHIALDRNNNVWFTHGARRIGVLNVKTATLSTWTLQLTGGFTVYTPPTSILKEADEDILEEDTDIGGFAVDVYDRVWIIDNLQNNTWVISATPFFQTAPIRYFKIRPKSPLGYYTDPTTGSTYTESEEGYFYRSAQAHGDWTGNKWYQKYAAPQTLSADAVSAVSLPFTVTRFENKNQIRRVNESFNTAKYYKDLALPEILSNNYTLFDSFLPGVVGNGALSANEDVGQKVYERIANFTNNHADIDTCGVDQLLSIAEQLNVASTDYSATYPSDIRDMIDIASIPRSKLWGLKDNTPLMPQSIGTQYNTRTDFLTAGTKIVIRNKLSGIANIIPVPLSGDRITVYPLSGFEGFGLIQPALQNYIFYRFKPVYSNQYIENIIDWDSEFTTLNPTASTLNSWYGDGGSIELAFKYLLTKNLFPK